MDFGSAKKSSRVSMDSLDRPSATGDSGTGGRDAIAPGQAIRSIGASAGLSDIGWPRKHHELRMTRSKNKRK